MGEDFLDFIKTVVEPDVLPVYRTEYPRRGRHDNDPYARATHGCLHISRCLIYSEAMFNYYETAGVPSSRFDKLAVRMALAWHDAGREADGADLWEADSGALASDYVQSRGLSASMGTYVASLIVHEARDMSDPNAHVVQACDTLDVLRVYPGRNFDRTRFGFLYRGDPCVDDSQQASGRSLRDRLIHEAESWIQYTEGWQLAPRMVHSATCCQDVLRTVEPGRFPTLAGLLKHTLG